MTNFENNLIDFALERINVSRQKLWNDPEYNELQEKSTAALKDLIGNNPETRAKYATFEDVEGQILVYHTFQTYLQGVRDAMSFKQLL